MKLDHLLSLYLKINSKYFIVLRKRVDVNMLLKEYRSQNIYDNWLSNNFLRNKAISYDRRNLGKIKLI
jgi:hypothetical protein